MEKFLIVNADEFGLTSAGNEAIADAYRNGIVTSTTLMANGWAFDDAISQARLNPGLGVGIHLNLTFGRPVAKACDVPSLLDDEGRLLERPALLRRWMTNRLRTGDVETELRAQTEKVLTSGLNPTHLDSHQNTMMIPGVFEIFIKIANEMNVPIRLPYEPPYFDCFSTAIKSFLTSRHAKKRFTSLLCDIRRPSLRSNRVRSVERVYSLMSCFARPGLSVTDRYEAIISRIGAGVHELLTHPSHPDGNLKYFLRGSSARAAQREKEYEALTSEQVKQAVRNSDIRLINYRDLGKCQLPARN